MASKGGAEGMLKIVGPLLVIFSIATSVYIGAIARGWDWFSYHPAAMIVAYVAMAGTSTLIKKVGGKTNTEIHGYLMTAAMLTACFGWYVIYTVKNQNSKPHNTSWHAWAGVATVVSWILMAPFGYFAFNPTNGFARTNKTLRLVHKLGGRFLIALAWFTCFLGWYKMQGEMVSRVAFGAPLVILAPICLL
eukprot:CAMPEP_0173390144 /NCGR_PEP_ID=MMETSP1356-20130122/14321_1 /TAXON_ID=77927 ORGANISM="Hemiselmis virescens, Strain PCC157" /NCGR_SAMPLE_ID=MMETSP1356 /ASSEMBLY_ACC=CAM_ASM_000847 /LENGTH=190 /DNA_ID=CAMNT_0014347469 /DNA_START=153 /DNA_END=725 /DNA_ORIENTATION=-